jgi:hypothetical protein
MTVPNISTAGPAFSVGAAAEDTGFQGQVAADTAVSIFRSNREGDWQWSELLLALVMPVTAKSLCTPPPLALAAILESLESAARLSPLMAPRWTRLLAMEHIAW